MDKNSLYKNEEIVKNLYKSDENPLQFVKTFDDESLYKNMNSVKRMDEDELFQVYKKHLPLLSKMVNIHHSIPDHVKKKIKDETCTSNSQLEDFIRKYRDEIIEVNYDFSHEIVPRENTV